MNFILRNPSGLNINHPQSVWGVTQSPSPAATPEGVE